MKAMDAELARSKSKPSRSEAAFRPETNDRGKGTATRNDDIDIEAAMEAELNKLMEDGDEDEESSEVDYQLIKHFLESFKSQGGLSGPVSTLVGRLQEGWTLPRDDS